jgi:hypothetical protein
VTLFHVSGLLFAVGFAVLGAMAGATRFGMLGALLGVPAGLVLGWFVGVAVVGLAFYVAIVAERLRHRRSLQSEFGRYWSHRRRRDWRSLRNRLRVGTPVSGRVVRSFYHGAILDIGEQFPARLSKLRMPNTPDEWHPSSESMLSAVVCHFDDFERIVELTQGDQPPTSAEDAELNEEHDRARVGDAPP